MKRLHRILKRSTFVIALVTLMLATAAPAFAELVNRMDGGDRSPAMLLTNPRWEIALTDYGYSDYLGYFRGYPHEMLSGEWGGAVSYERYDPANGAWVPVFSWLDPEWIFPDWNTGSNFGVVTPLSVWDSNGDTFIDAGYSEISNGDLMIKISHRMVRAQTPMGLGLGGGASILSELWVLKEDYEFIAVTPNMIRNVNYYRFLHGHPSEDFEGGVVEDYDNAFYNWDDPVWPGQDCYIHDITQRSNFGGNQGTLGTEYIGFHSLQAPSGYGLGHYRGGAPGKPATGLHIDVENNALMNNHGLYGPDEVAGAMRWFFCDMVEGDTAEINLILSIAGEEEIGCCNVDVWGEFGQWNPPINAFEYPLVNCPGQGWSDQIMACFADCDGAPLHFFEQDFQINLIQQSCSDDLSGIRLFPGAPETDAAGCMPFILEVPECISACCELVWEIRAGDCVFYFRLDLKTTDLTGDGRVDDQDLEYFHLVAMPQQDLCADFNHDGIVDPQDEIHILNMMGCDCPDTPVGDALVPGTFGIVGNQPNPFNPKTDILFNLTETGEVKLRVYSVSGRELATLVDGNLPAGRHTVNWDGKTADGESVTSGIYFARIESGGETATRKMTLLK